jgi:hypothetical protein
MPRVCTALAIAAAAMLGGCAGQQAASGPSMAATEPAAAPANSSAGGANPLPTYATGRPAPQPEPEPVLSEREASAQCWMKYENGRRSLDLDTRAKLVDKCIAEKMHGRAAR